jgi:hypothetical protein
VNGAAQAPGPDVVELRTYLVGNAIAAFTFLELVVIWDVLPNKEIGKVLKQRNPAAVAVDSAKLSLQR